jgi:cyclopropane fatty-acyl-phospholipid synthase-like methyltransferase
MPHSDSRLLRSLRSALEVPAAYDLWWKLVGGPACAKALVKEHIQPQLGSRILEIGCGPGMILRYLPDCTYVGFDISSKYIAMAQKRFPRAQFFCQRVSRFSLAGQPSFDTVLAIGIVHHLDDQEATQLFQIAYDALRPGGKLVTLDGVFTDDQSAAERWLLARDRGEYVRGRPEYLRIASQVFSNIRPTVRHDLLRIPYTHLITECVR